MPVMFCSGVCVAVLSFSLSRDLWDRTQFAQSYAHSVDVGPRDRLPDFVGPAEAGFIMRRALLRNGAERGG